jgi:CRISPR-associated helicase Cas3
MRLLGDRRSLGRSEVLNNHFLLHIDIKVFLGMGLLEEIAKRAGVREVLRSLEEELVPRILRDEPTILHVELPTGYGKSMTSALIAKKLASGEGKISEHVSRVIHVVPTKYLVEDLVKGALSLSAEARTELTIRGQCMFFDPSLKDPYFLSDLVFTTFDSYVLNFFKIPIAEVELMLSGLSHGHFDLPRYAILSAVNVLDEYHIFVPDDVEIERATDYEARAWTALNVIVENLLKSRTPVILETATPRLDALSSLPHERGNAKFVRIALKLRRDSEITDGIAVYDDGFTAKLERASYKTEFESGKLAEVTLKYVDKMEKPLLVACNNIRTAVEVYHALKERGTLEVHLMHSLFTVGDRKRKLRKLHWLMKQKGGRELAVVATQVIEVGVNLDFASMITDAAPLASLAQRVGRVNRGLSERSSEVLVVYDSSQVSDKSKTYAGVYDLELTKLTLQTLQKAKSKGDIGWRMSVVEDFVEMRGKTYVTISALAKGVYMDKTPHVDIEYGKVLQALLHYQMDSRAALKCLQALGSFVRDDVLIPVYVPREEPEKGSLLFRRDRLIPCQASKLGFDLRRKNLDVKIASKVLKLSDGDLWTIVEGKEGPEVKKLSQRKVVESVMHGIVRLDHQVFFLRALIAKPDAYSKSEGLKVW